MFDFWKKTETPKSHTQALSPPDEKAKVIVLGCAADHRHGRIKETRDMWIRMFIQAGFSEEIAEHAVDVACADLAKEQLRYMP